MVTEDNSHTQATFPNFPWVRIPPPGCILPFWAPLESVPLIVRIYPHTLLFSPCQTLFLNISPCLVFGVHAVYSSGLLLTRGRIVTQTTRADISCGKGRNVAGFQEQQKPGTLSLSLLCLHLLFYELPSLLLQTISSLSLETWCL